MNDKLIKWHTKGKRLTPYEHNRKIIELLETKNHLKNWVIFVLVVALIFSNT